VWDPSCLKDEFSYEDELAQDTPFGDPTMALDLDPWTTGSILATFKTTLIQF
jgi:hypothetical protein